MDWSGQMFQAIPSAATSPLALVAYMIAAATTVVLAIVLRRHHNLLKRIDALPENERTIALRDEMGPRLKDGMTADQWIRSRNWTYLFLAALAILFAVLVFGLAALQQSQFSGKQDGHWHGRLQEKSPVGYFPGVEVVNARHIVDFSKWTPAAGPSKDTCCQVVWDISFTLRRVRKEAQYFARRAATTGGEPKVTSQTHTVDFREIVNEVMGGPAMKKYDVIFDISAEQRNVPFELQMRTVRFGSFSDSGHENAYMDIMQPTRTETLELHFSPSKPGRNFRYVSYANVDGASEHPITPAPNDLDLSVPNVLKWTVPLPVLGSSYKVEWDW